MSRILVLFALVLLIGCHEETSKYNDTIGNQDRPEAAMQMSEEIEIEPPRTAQASNRKEQESKIIKKANIVFEVGTLAKAKTRVDSFLSYYQGYYENENYQAYSNRNTYNLKIRVLNSKFDSLMFNLENGLGELKSKSVSAENVTEEYLDLNIRLENKLAYLKQYQSILKKAKTIREILEVQEKIRRIEEEIESKKGRIKYLDNKVKYATIHLELSQIIIKDFSNKPSFFVRVATAFKNGIDWFLNFVVGVVSFWPFVLILLFLFFWKHRIWAWVRRKKS